MADNRFEADRGRQVDAKHSVSVVDRFAGVLREQNARLANDSATASCWRAQATRNRQKKKTGRHDNRETSNKNCTNNYETTTLPPTVS